VTLCPYTRLANAGERALSGRVGRGRDLERGERVAALQDDVGKRAADVDGETLHGTKGRIFISAAQAATSCVRARAPDPSASRELASSGGHDRDRGNGWDSRVPTTVQAAATAPVKKCLAGVPMSKYAPRGERGWFVRAPWAARVRERYGATSMEDTAGNRTADIPAQSQDGMPADEHVMTPAPDYTPRHPGSGRLEGKVALITGGDSGIGRAVAVLFAREGAHVAISYLDEHEDAEETRRIVEQDESGRALLLPGDIADKAHATRIVEQTVAEFGTLDILVNNAAMQFWATDLRDIEEHHLRRTFDSNVMGYFFVTQAALSHLKNGSTIVNTASVNAFMGMGELVDYSSTRGAIVAFSRSLAKQLMPSGIRVNTVAPGPIWTPFIPGTLPEDAVEGFGSQAPMGRAGQPWEVATSFLFLASSDGNYMTGQTLHPNGGIIVGA